MGPLPALPPWIPEDDLLLKNAVEAGASLESLAKGAVRFSRRYSLAELRERWYSLLYDPVISREASAAMAKLDHAKSFCVGIVETVGDHSGGCQKRKGDSIRKKYYAVRKRLCNEFFDSFDMSVNAEMKIENNAVVADVAGSDKIDDKDVNKNNLAVNSLVGCRNCSGLEKSGVGPSHSNSTTEVPRKIIEDVTAPAMPVQVSLKNENGSSESKETIPDGLKGRDAVLNDSDAAVVVGVETHFSDSLVFMDIDRKDETSTDKQSSDNVDSRVLGGVGFVSDPGKELHLSAAVQISHPKPDDDFMFCILNSEDPDIPSNDIVNISTVVSHPVTLTSQSTVKQVDYPDLSISNQRGNEPVTLKSQSIVKEVGYPDLHISNQRRNESAGSLRKEGILPHSFAASETVRPGSVANISSSNSPVSVVPRTENSARNSIPALNISLSNSKLVHATTVHASDRHMIQEEVYARTNAEKHKALPDHGEGGDGAADDDDCDDISDDTATEIPYFSDVEGMILQMDLSPTDQDTNASREVLKYHHEESKRSIMRLEQCAWSCTHRVIASQGALAVLYGHKTEQYIKKSEVILGRATEDLHVDIDLSREGRANKISRRQASIKLEENGSFIIKNFGKSSIFVNGKEVPKGKLRGLRSNSLIEVRGLSFIFEVDDKSVRKFIEEVNEQRER